MPTLYGHPMSGNSYKVKLLLSLLNIDYEWVTVDLMKGEHKQPEFLKLSPFGQVPVLTDGDMALADAQGSLVYLARQYDPENRWLPTEPVALANVIRWLSITTGEVRQGPESARLYHLFGAKAINIERANEKATFILSQLNQHLGQHEWLVGTAPTIADVAVFPYVALSPDGKIDLSSYPQVLSWIERVKQLPGFVGMRGIEAPAVSA
ncbi:glutathione S-transferase family protein [Leptothoe sp. PORK10 BA2]|uniref:glutathione S-transferase family protein n=1 Tax=Leptothoe sp. PORK10 BA2 TaxID=3110254 RepID=UPI002B1F34AA|nr:glutathione S-transferase [Leptothoe sp. PORK10 BA2]MEA5465986.1 glutathione S-transferase [Leptothoe sp. PORK10 BA2]